MTSPRRSSVLLGGRREREREGGGRGGEIKRQNKNNVYMSRCTVDIGSFDYFKN